MNEDGYVTFVGRLKDLIIRIVLLHNRSLNSDSESKLTIKDREMLSPSFIFSDAIFS
jgi:hypothetical protein